jgi:hypothetical protein
VLLIVAGIDVVYRRLELIPAQAPEAEEEPS